MESIKTPKRPTYFDEAVIRDAAKEIAPKVKEWGKDEENSLDSIESDLVKAIRHHSDGYEIAKSLESRGYSPDSELVEILDYCSFAKMKARDKAQREWVTANGIKEIPLQTRVTLSRKPEAGIGIVVKNHPEGKSTVNFASAGHVPEGQMGSHGYVLEWEQLEIVK